MLDGGSRLPSVSTSEHRVVDGRVSTVAKASKSLHNRTRQILGSLSDSDDGMNFCHVVSRIPTDIRIVHSVG